MNKKIASPSEMIKMCNSHLPLIHLLMSHPLVDQYLIQKYILFRNLSMAESYIMGIILDGHLTLWITYKINCKHNTKIYQKKNVQNGFSKHSNHASQMTGTYTP